MGCASPLYPVRARQTGVTPSGDLPPRPHFADSVPPSCMHILRPVIGLVEGVWWGGCLSEGVGPRRKLHLW